MKPPSAERLFDWRGETVVIAASGPSITREQVAHAKGKARVIAINETYQLAAFADALYACDWQWIGRRGPRREDFAGARIMGVAPRPQQIRPEMVARLDTFTHCAYVRAGIQSMVFDGPGIGAGKSSAFQAANLAVRWGASRIVLLGVDCHSPNDHWHGGHGFIEASRQSDELHKAWIAAWTAAADQLAERGVAVVNCSPGSAVKCFPAARVEEVFA